jgi:hypothetical protein
MLRRHRTPWVVVLFLLALTLSAAACSDPSVAARTSGNPARTTAAGGAGRDVTVPNVAGDPMDQAISSIQAVGLALGGIYVDPTGPKTSVVLGTTPAAGSRVPVGTKITFDIGSGN